MPIPLLWNVKMNTNAKISVGAILGLGIFASISACIRLKYTVNLTSSTEYLCKITPHVPEIICFLTRDLQMAFPTLLFGGMQRTVLACSLETYRHSGLCSAR